MKRSVFITGRFRSGSTLLWNLFKQIPEVCAFYEPLHEQLVEFARAGIKPQARHFNVERYFDEYIAVEGLENHHSPEFGLTHLLLEEGDKEPKLASYIRHLLLSTDSSKTPVLQFNRIDFRLPWIRKNFPHACIIHLYRDPRDQWISTRRGYPGNVDKDLEADPYRITTWSRSLVGFFPFLASPFIKHLYQRHYYLWKLSYLAGSRLADYSISYEEIIQKPKTSIENLLAWADLSDPQYIDLSMKILVERPLEIWGAYRDRQFFEELEQECEATLEELGLNKRFGIASIQKIIGQCPKYQDFLAHPLASQWAIDSSHLAISKLWKSLDDKEEVIGHLELRKIEKDTVIQEKDTVIQEKDTVIQEKDTVIQEKETVIQNFRSSFIFWIRNGPLHIIPSWFSLWGLIGRIRQAFLPKLGVFIQYPPKPLKISPSYDRSAVDASRALKISIVTPSYNQASFIERTIRSVLDQNYANLEYVIQDGASTDGTFKIIQQYGDRLSHYESLHDKGQAHAVNLGFRRTTGEIMAFLNSDDMLVPETLHYVARYFAKHPNVDVVYGHRIIVDENDDEVGRWVLPPHDRKMLEWGDYVPQETMFWRRQIWEKTGGKIDESFQFALDWDLLIRFQQAGARIVRLPRFLAIFRVHGEQKSTALINDLGLREMNLLRQRIHGREVRLDEINNNLRAYLRRSVIYHKLYRLGLLRY